MTVRRAIVLSLLTAAACSDDLPPVQPQADPPRVVISELMYHPVGEQTAQEEHEFVELHNPGASSVNLSGWQLTGGIRLIFAAGTKIAGGGYLVVAKRRT